MARISARTTDFSLREARSIALAAQGFDQSRPTRPTIRHIRGLIRHLGLLQLDYVNVLVPAHYQVLFSRLGPYARTRFDEAVYGEREFTEQWAHEASVVPMDLWPLLRYRMEAFRVRPWGFEKFLEKHPTYVRDVLKEVERRGPIGADNLSDPPSSLRRMSDQWGWGAGVKRQVLEAHFGRGTLAVTNRRPNFQREYDLSERVIPETHRNAQRTEVESQRELLRRAGRACGIGTAADLADYFRIPVRDARGRLAELVEGGELRTVEVEGWTEAAYLASSAQVPARIDAATLVSPFDPLIWYRPRVARLFEFDYRIEIFVPRPKRKWGYYVLPFLLNDRLVARVDLKADRQKKRLLVLASHHEQHGSPDQTAAALATELRTLAGWLGLASISVGPRGRFARAMRAVIRSSHA